MVCDLDMADKKRKKKVFDAKALGHQSGLKGGKARAEKLSSTRRIEIAKKAAKARWEK